jgi:HSP20 family protein
MRTNDLFVDFDRAVESFLRPAYAPTGANYTSGCDIAESADRYLVSFDAPGVQREDIKIEVNGNRLIISGERTRAKTDDQANNDFQWVRTERSYGKFHREFTLGTNVDTERIEASFEDGVLNISIPKTAAARPRTIPIQTGPPSFFSKLVGGQPKGTKD